MYRYCASIHTQTKNIIEVNARDVNKATQSKAKVINYNVCRQQGQGQGQGLDIQGQGQSNLTVIAI